MLTSNRPHEERSRNATGRRVGRAAIASAVLITVAFWSGMTPAFAANGTVGLGTAAPYSVLGGQTVTNTGPTTLSGDLGVSPGTAITGFPPGIAGGSIHAGDAVAAQAQSDLGIAYDDAAGRATTEGVAGDLVGRTLIDGVYTSSGPLALSGTLTFDGQGNPDSVFIVQVASTLTTATASDVEAINGAQACHIFWQVGSSATLGTASTFQGTIMALTSISVTTGATVKGRALARNGSVTLDNNVFTDSACAPIVTTTPTSSSPTPTSTPKSTAPATTAATTAAPTASATRPRANIALPSVTPPNVDRPNVGGPNLGGPNVSRTGSLAATGTSLTAGGVGLAFLLAGGGLIWLARGAQAGAGRSKAAHAPASRHGR